ncbi:protein kinase domain-containing protein [Streptomyces camelliae]|uniref:Protein kinase n=1 Tax=Streptomyces camelliae TaxID=3004093 RepID=A0ABY7P1N2_9ACTN|nr:protein kinase [Streptomyces sp. HUAS 2-6]WBO64426.1 protein kinase [Streptomyces sp. HUAS 2-6]
MFSPLAHDDPESLGAHQLIARLGSGGMGTVYLGRSDTGRVVALKTMHARIAADPVFRTRFRLETDAARVIGGEHGARVFDADIVHETPWLATEYLIGPPLDDAVRLNGPLPERAVRALGARLCAALAQLHDSDVVHRDLKPSNIIVTADGPKVIDFGIARALGDDHLTRVGAAAGTPAFMSPEQAAGGEHSPAGDVFALAGVLVHAATGRGPFGMGQAADLLYRVRYAEPDLTGVPAGLFSVLLPCFAKDPLHRPTTGQLRSYLDGHEGEFVDCLPEPVLVDIARRASDVWRVEPRRLPPQAGHGMARTAAVGERERMSRRRLLMLGGGTAFGVAAAGTGAWAWLSGRGAGTPARPGPTSPAQREPTWDLLWQASSDYHDPLVPPAPLLLDRLLIVGQTELKGLSPTSGKALWPQYAEVSFQHRTATDGTLIHTLVRGHEDAASLTVCRVDPADGSVGEPLIELKDLNGELYGTQLLCATDAELYAVAGRGSQPTDSDSFRKGQTWYLLAFDLRARKKLWDVPLPARPEGSQRLHFLSAQVSGGRLVLVQQAADGATQLVVRDTGIGRLLWSRTLDSAQPTFSRARLAVDDRHVYPSAGGLLALGLDDGKVAWHYDKGPAGAAYSPPAVKDGVVYAVEAGRGVVAVDAGSGEPHWTEKGGDATAADLLAPPVVGLAYVYRNASSRLAAVDLADGGTTRPFKAAAAAHYFAHPASRRLIALGENYTAGYPLL